MESCRHATYVHWKRYAAIVLAAAAVMFYLYGRIDPTKALFREWDLHAYLSMANAAPALDASAPRPFAYRILSPYLAGVLPGPSEAGFYALNLILSASLVLLTYGFFIYFDLRPAFACLTTVFYIMNKSFFGFTSWNYFHVSDVITNICIIVLFWSLLELKWRVFAAALLVGAATRETIFLMLPVALLSLAERRILTREWGKLAFAAVPALACFAAIHAFIHPVEGPTIMQGLAAHWRKITSAERMFHVLVNPFVPLALVPVVFIDKTAAFLRGRLYLLLHFLLILGTLLFGANNERLAHPTFIVFYLVIGFIIEHYIYPERKLLVLIAIGCFLSSLHWLSARYPLPSREATGWFSGSSLLAIAAALLLFRVMRSRSETTAPAP